MDYVSKIKKMGTTVFLRDLKVILTKVDVLKQKFCISQSKQVHLNEYFYYGDALSGTTAFLSNCCINLEKRIDKF